MFHFNDEFNLLHNGAMELRIIEKVPGNEKMIPFLQEQ